MKKLISVLIALVLVVGAMFTLVACDTTDKDKPATVMNVSLNPEVEFVLDGNGKVISVNALNEDGNLIITAADFEGKTAEEAAALFVQVAHEMGFLVSGDTGIKNNDLSFSFSGDDNDAKKLFDDVKASVSEYFSEENINATIQEAEAIGRAKLEELVKQCQPYIDAAKLQALSHMELIEQIYESRKETHEMYSQELKNAYYNAKAAAMDTTKIQALKEQMGTKFDDKLVKLFDTYTAAVENIEAQRMTHLVSAESKYQVALAEVRAKKVEYLQFRKELAESGKELSTGETLFLDTKELAVTTAESALVLVGEAANEILDGLKTIVTSSYNALVSEIESAQVVIADHLDAIMQAQEEQVPVFAAEFKASYANAVAQAKSDWEAMKQSLQPATEAE